MVSATPTAETDRPAGSPERRAAHRRRVLFSGKIIYSPGITADCSIRDLSQAGGQVAMRQSQACPKEFYLIVIRDGVAHRARTVWTRYPLAGVAFEASHDLTRSPPTRLQAVHDLWAAVV